MKNRWDIKYIQILPAPTTKAALGNTDEDLHY